MDKLARVLAAQVKNLQKVQEEGGPGSGRPKRDLALDLANFKFLINVFFSGGQSKIFQGHGDPVETAVILPDGRKSAVGYSDGSMRIFDLRSGEVVHNLSLFKNKAAICAIDSR